MRTPRNIALVLAAAAWMATAAGYAEAAPAADIHGTVVDQSGGVIFDAVVTVENDSHEKRQTRTNAEGKYSFDQLAEGGYTFSVTFPGFIDFSSHIDVVSGANKPVDVALSIAVTMSVEVKQETATLSAEPQRNLSSFVLTGADIERLPDDPQLFLLRILDLAGANGNPDDVALYVDGFREFRRLPPKNAIEMIRINSNPFSAEFSQPSLKRIEILIKPGADSFHGDMRLQARHSALDARNPMAATKSDMRYRNYNGYVQGPVVRNRIGFLGYAGEWKQDDNAFVHATVLEEGGTGANLLRETVPTPVTTRSGMVKTDFHLNNQIVNVSYTRTTETRRNQGLDGGLALPEHAFDSVATDDVGRLWWTTRGRTFVRDVRFELSRSVEAYNPLARTAAITVLDAFAAGGNQGTDVRASAVGLHGSDTIAVQHGAHTIKAGLQVDTTIKHTVDRSGFGGAFLFGADVERDVDGRPLLTDSGATIAVSPIENYRRTILRLPGYGPSQFSIATGNPNLNLQQWNVGWFALDDWIISKRLSLSYGLREETQTNVDFGANLAPRFSFSWLLDEKRKNALKAGAGIFYTDVAPDITLQTLKSNGRERQQLIVQQPSFFAAIPATLTGAVPTRPVVYTKSDDLHMPYSFVMSLGYERALSGHLFAIGQYQVTRGVDLLRLRNIADADVSVSKAARSVLQFESTGRSLHHEMMLGLRSHFSGAFTVYGNYTVGKKYSDTDGPYTVAADSLHPASEYGAAADDQRQQLLAGATLHVFSGLLIDSTATFASGRPFNITTGSDNNGDTVFTDRPSFASASDGNAVATKYGLLDPDAQPGEVIIPRNYGREPKQVNVNLAVSKNVYDQVAVTVDAENLLNANLLYGSNGVLTSPTFGIPNQAKNARRVELTIRYSF